MLYKWPFDIPLVANRVYDAFQRVCASSRPAAGPHFMVPLKMIDKSNVQST